MLSTSPSWASAPRPSSNDSEASLLFRRKQITEHGTSFLYAHKIHTLWFHNINKPEKWGFASSLTTTTHTSPPHSLHSENQVTPFHLKTCDDVTLYAWHILPLPLYIRHQETLCSQPTGFCPDFSKTANFRLLQSDPSARLIIYRNLPLPSLISLAI